VAKIIGKTNMGNFTCKSFNPDLILVVYSMPITSNRYIAIHSIAYGCFFNFLNFSLYFPSINQTSAKVISEADIKNKE